MTIAEFWDRLAWAASQQLFQGGVLVGIGLMGMTVGLILIWKGA